VTFYKQMHRFSGLNLVLKIKRQKKFSELADVKILL
jgi:hypothetical protein